MTAPATTPTDFLAAFLNPAVPADALDPAALADCYRHPETQDAIQASIALCAQRLSLRLLRALEQAAEAITAALATDPANLRGLADTLARLANAAARLTPRPAPAKPAPSREPAKVAAGRDPEHPSIERIAATAEALAMLRRAIRYAKEDGPAQSDQPPAEGRARAASRSAPSQRTAAGSPPAPSRAQIRADAPSAAGKTHPRAGDQHAIPTTPPQNLLAATG